MPTQIFWHHPQRVLYIKFSGALKSDTLLNSAEYAAERLTEASQSVHVIMDMRRVAGVQKNTTLLRNNLAPLLTHSRLGWTTVITSNILLQTYLNRAAHRMTSRWGYVNSFSEAVRFMRQVDTALPNIPISLGNTPRSAYMIR